MGLPRADDSATGRRADDSATGSITPPSNVSIVQKMGGTWASSGAGTITLPNPLTPGNYLIAMFGGLSLSAPTSFSFILPTGITQEAFSLGQGENWESLVGGQRIIQPGDPQAWVFPSTSGPGVYGNCGYLWEVTGFSQPPTFVISSVSNPNTNGPPNGSNSISFTLANALLMACCEFFQDIGGGSIAVDTSLPNVPATGWSAVADESAPGSWYGGMGAADNNSVPIGDYAGGFSYMPNGSNPQSGLIVVGMQ